jgi:tetratricopeptide (TPR) repeat protein/ssDNA-binding Zn-finger/Zn-ribbon topoisomerase 1
MMVKPNLFILHWIFVFAAFSLMSVVNAAEFVGSAQCAGCHQSQTTAWQGSHHDMAMRHAKSDSVLGDFDNVSIESKNQTSRFFQKGEEYWVNIAGPDGDLNDYKISYTFGVEPLQQYMVEFPDGRVQLIPFAWDSREAAEGGQRWFDLYPEQTQKHQEFFWTNTGQNWNYMCADCHSTNVEKNFNVKDNSYNTTFSEINVGCEACHGPASDHMAWSKAPNETPVVVTKHAGFDRNLSKPVKRWVAEPGKTILQPEHTSEKTEASQQTLVCAQCHSRHLQISTKDHVASQSLGDRYVLNLIDAQRYYPDGQVYDENFVYGSFLQSKMNKMGVVCSNCHDSHSAKLILPKETVCLQCHQAETYASATHHHHEESSEGAQCVNCHMPATTYMEIDVRRDHGWHIPRPDFAKSLGTPDTCLSCHDDKDSDWSSNATEVWRAASNKKIDNAEDKPFAPVFFSIDRGYNQAASALSHVAQNNLQAPIIRASALARMDRVIDRNTLVAIARGLKNDDELIRLGAVRGAQGMQGAERWRLLAPRLTDSVLAVRIEAANALVSLWQSLSKTQQDQLMPALNEYLLAQDFNADRGFAHTNKGNVYVQLGRYLAAEAAFEDSIRIEPHFANAYVNLADLYRSQRNDSASIEVLQTGELACPDNGILPYSLGLAYIRAKNTTKAIEYLRKATLVEPENPRFHYVYGVGLDSIEPRPARIAIRKAYQLSGNPQYLYALCEMQIRHKTSEVQQCLEELRTVAPEEAVNTLESQFSGPR